MTSPPGGNFTNGVVCPKYRIQSFSTLFFWPKPDDVTPWSKFLSLILITIIVEEP